MKKLLALIMVIAMVASFATIISADDETKVVAHYTFDENKADDGLMQTGTVTYADGKATFGADGFLSAPIDLKGATSIKVTVKLTAPTDVSAARWIFELSSEDKHPNNDEHYLAAFFKGKNDYIDAETYAGGARPDGGCAWSAVDPTQPIEYVLTYDDATRTLTSAVTGGGDPMVRTYDEDKYTIANMVGENTHLQLGRANWNDGEFANTLVIDEITVEATFASTPAQGGDTPTPGGQGGQSGQGGQTAPATGFATVAIALAAVCSGAYVVSKKRH